MSWANEGERQYPAAIETLLHNERVGGLAFGVTTGEVFCGSIGNKRRAEYGMVGAKVVLAARLMAAVLKGSHERASIIVDSDTYQVTKEVMSFETDLDGETIVERIKVKGREDLVETYRPSKELSIFRKSTSFTGSMIQGRALRRRVSLPSHSLMAGALLKPLRHSSEGSSLVYRSSSFLQHASSDPPVSFDCSVRLEDLRGENYSIAESLPNSPGSHKTGSHSGLRGETLALGHPNTTTSGSCIFGWPLCGRNREVQLSLTSEPQTLIPKHVSRRWVPYTLLRKLATSTSS